jgi:mRNA interferase RelE/StbE
VKYSILISPRAQRQIKKLPKSIQQQIISELQELEIIPRPQDVDKLSCNDDLYRVRVGDYRIIYQINDPQNTLIIAKVAHRREVYKRL